TRTKREASETRGGGIRRDGLRCLCSQEGRKDGRFFGSSTVEPDTSLASGSHHGGASRRRDRISSLGPTTSVPPSARPILPVTNLRFRPVEHDASSVVRGVFTCSRWA